MLFLAIFVAGMIYGMGTHNTGTAMRHRNKFMSLMLISYIATKDKFIDGKKEEIFIPTVGEHNIYNAMAAILVGS